MSLQPTLTVASGEDMGTKKPSKRATVGHWSAREQPQPEGCEAISNNPPALGYRGYRSSSLSLSLHRFLTQWQSINFREGRCWGALPDDVRQDDELDQPKGQSHLLVPHQHHPRGVILEEEGGHPVHALLPHGCARAVPQPPGSSLRPGLGRARRRSGSSSVCREKKKENKNAIGVALCTSGLSDFLLCAGMRLPLPISSGLGTAGALHGLGVGQGVGGCRATPLPSPNATRTKPSAREGCSLAWQGPSLGMRRLQAGLGMSRDHGASLGQQMWGSRERF